MLYRILTENKNLAKIEKLINTYFEGYTLIKGKGYWKLQKENSLIIEIETSSDDDKIKELAKAIKKLNKQEAVMVQRFKNVLWLL